ncbi:hypothetical protein SUGI_0915380 [Cryptomeria japonica]|nr:hypothetical protein SUGI_0915380 [Cryptomeria japonica]
MMFFARNTLTLITFVENRSKVVVYMAKCVNVFLLFLLLTAPSAFASATRGTAQTGAVDFMDHACYGGMVSATLYAKM